MAFKVSFMIISDAAPRLVKLVKSSSRSFTISTIRATDAPNLSPIKSKSFFTPAVPILT